MSSRWPRRAITANRGQAVMADKPVTIRRERIGRRVGRLDEQDIARLNIALAFVMGLAD
jgi:mRNA interferase MazF